MTALRPLLETLDVARLHVYSDREAGLLAFLVIDDLTLGPAAGGIRTTAYPSEAAALRDAARLARAMTLKCSLAGVDAGGAKMVVLDRPDLDRRRAFELLGRRIQELDGLFLTAGDLGTTARDLEVLARQTSYVEPDEEGLAEATARGVAECLEACRRVRGIPRDATLTAAVQGCGAMGSAVARELARRGVDLLVTDLREDPARRVADATGGEVMDPAEWIEAPADVLVPCAGGEVLGTEAVPRVRAGIICGAANNPLADEAVGSALFERGILFVPDVISSAGALIEGYCRTRGHDPGPLITRLGETAEAVLRAALHEDRPPEVLATERARARIQAARG